MGRQKILVTTYTSSFFLEGMWERKYYSPLQPSTQQDSSVRKVTSYRLDYQGSIASRGREFSLHHHCVQSTSGVH